WRVVTSAAGAAGVAQHSPRVVRAVDLAESLVWPADEVVGLVRCCWGLAGEVALLGRAGVAAGVVRSVRCCPELVEVVGLAGGVGVVEAVRHRGYAEVAGPCRVPARQVDIAAVRSARSLRHRREFAGTHLANPFARHAGEGDGDEHFYFAEWDPACSAPG
ncbi:MAG TPA: hypothetical protein VF788_04560, partial [Pseudonocardiaceae bacterium]